MAIRLLGLVAREIMAEYMFRTRVKEQIVAEFLPPSRELKTIREAFGNGYRQNLRSKSPAGVINSTDVSKGADYR
jgi:hypothetical protein